MLDLLVLNLSNPCIHFHIPIFGHCSESAASSHIVVHTTVLAVVVGVTSRKSGFPSDTRAENRRDSILWAERRTVLEGKKGSVSVI